MEHNKDLYVRTIDKLPELCPRNKKIKFHPFSMPRPV